MRKQLKIIRNLLTPAALLAIAVMLRPYLSDIDAVQTFYFEVLTLIILGVATIISWRLEQHQCFYFLLSAFFYSLILTLNLIQVIHLAQFQTILIVAAFLVFTPLNFVVFETWKTESFLSKKMFWHFLLVVVEVAATLWAIGGGHLLIAPYLYSTFLPPVFVLPDHIPHLAVVFFITALCIQSINVSLKQNTIDSALLVSIVAFFIGIYFVDVTTVHFLMFSTIGIMLCIAFFQDTHNIAFVDSLTNLPSRRAMKHDCGQLGEQYAIAVLSVDQLEKINETFGHRAGNQVLQKIAKFLRKIPVGAQAYRYQREKFAIIYPEKIMSEVLSLLDSFREDIAMTSFAIRNTTRQTKLPQNRPKEISSHTAIKITVSVGVAERSRINRKMKDVQKSAEYALHRAKNTGQNKVCF